MLPSIGYAEVNGQSPTAFRIGIIIRSEVLGKRYGILTLNTSLVRSPFPSAKPIEPYFIFDITSRFFG
jgi:hypothetical protein